MIFCSTVDKTIVLQLVHVSCGSLPWANEVCVYYICVRVCVRAWSRLMICWSLLPDIIERAIGMDTTVAMFFDGRSRAFKNKGLPVFIIT